MGARRAAAALGLAALALVAAAAAPVAAAPTIVVETPGGGAGDFQRADLSRPGERGGRISGPFGTTQVGDVTSTVTGEGENLRITVTVPLTFTVNTARIGEKYRVTESGPCEGLEFEMTEQFIKDHELEHVAHLREEIEKFVRSVLETGNRGLYKSAGAAGGMTGSPSDPAWRREFQKNVKDLVDRFLRQEAEEYRIVEKTGRFPRSGEFEGLELRARRRSCDEFMKTVGHQVVTGRQVLDDGRQAVKDAKDAAKDAARQAGQAQDAAAAALAAASRKPCDMAAFARAVERYDAAVAAARRHAEDARARAAAARDAIARVEALLAEYDQAKVQAHVSAFPTMDARRRELANRLPTLRREVEALEAQVAPALEKVGQTLAAAAATLGRAYEKVKDCDKANDPRYRPLLDALARTFAPAGGGAGAPPGTAPGTPPAADPGAPQAPAPEASEPRSLRSAIDSLESEQRGGAMLPFVPAPEPERSPVPRVRIPSPPIEPLRERRHPAQPCSPYQPEEARKEIERQERYERALRERQEVEEREARTRAASRRARGLATDPQQPAVPYVPGMLGESEAAGSEAIGRLGSLIQSQPDRPAPSGAPGFVPDQVLAAVRIAPPAVVQPIVRDLEARLNLRRLGAADLASIGVQLVLFEVAAGRTVASAVAAVAADPRVLFAQPNFLSVTAGEPADAMAGMQYGPRMLKVPQAFPRVTGKAVRVAVIDTGADGQHPDLVNRIVARANFADGADAGEVHGTAVAGIIAATAGNGVGIYGVAPEAAILAARACRPRAAGQSDGVCTSYALARALDWAMVHGARVINLSVAGPRDQVLPRLLARAHERGIVVVAAAGNLGPGAPPPYPAAVASVIAVTAVDARAALYHAAVHGPFVSVAAPGVEVLSTHPGGRFGVHTGTSMAAAHVSGVVALLLQARPDLGPAAVRQALEATARPLGGGRNAQFGHGLVDGCRAVDAALGGRLGC